MSDLYVSTAMYFPRPYIMFSGKPNETVSIQDKMSDGRSNTRQTTIQYDQLGFRITKDLTRKKERDEIRVFMVGGSTVFHGAPLDNTISGRLEALFRDDGRKNVHVCNFGVPSYVSGQELALMVHVLPQLEPDLVVVYNGGNDVTQPCFFEPRPGYPYNFMVNEFLLQTLQGNGSGKLSIEVKKNMDTDGIRQACGYGTELWEKKIVAEYVGNIHKMFKIGRGFGFRIAVFLQPLLVFKRPLAGAEPQFLGVTPFQEYLRRQYDRIRCLLAELQASDPITRGWIFDLSVIFDNYPDETFWDYIHVDNTGNGHVAGHIYDFLKHLT